MARRRLRNTRPACFSSLRPSRNQRNGIVRMPSQTPGKSAHRAVARHLNPPQHPRASRNPREDGQRRHPQQSGKGEPAPRRRRSTRPAGRSVRRSSRALGSWKLPRLDAVCTQWGAHDGHRRQGKHARQRPRPAGGHRQAGAAEEGAAAQEAVGQVALRRVDPLEPHGPPAPARRPRGGARVAGASTTRRARRRRRASGSRRAAAEGRAARGRPPR